MSEPSVLICGTGRFAARILLDIAATADAPLSVHLAGRNRGQLDRLELLAKGRAAIFDRTLRVASHSVDLMQPNAVAELINTVRPEVVVQAASTQPVAVLRGDGDRWTELVRNGGYSVTLVFQAIVSARIAMALAEYAPHAALINCCLPDVVNPMLAASGLPVLSGVGNIAILANILRGRLPPAQRPGFRMLAHYRNLHDWRSPRTQRHDPPVRIWLNDTEVDDVYAAFPLQLDKEPMPDISGASGVPLILAIAYGRSWRGHMPGPLGLPGGYPVRYEDGELRLDLPQGITEQEAVRWNEQFECTSGAVVHANGRVEYTGALRQYLAAVAPELAAGFDCRDLERVWTDMQALRARLLA